MQMHAYLESLLKFSDAQQEMITVLYCETEQIRYEKLMQSFPKVTWLKENKFEEDLKKGKKSASERRIDAIFARARAIRSVL